MELSECLVYEVLSDPSDWLTKGSFGELVALLKGVQVALCYSSRDVSEWSLHGSLRLHAHRNVITEINRAHADVEHVFSNTWVRRLQSILEQDALRDELGPVYRASPYSAGVFILYHDMESQIGGSSELAIWRSVIRRPPMWMGGGDAATWHAFLLGCTRGAQWLGVDPSSYASRIQACFHNYVQTHLESSHGFYLSQSDAPFLSALAFQAVEDL